MTNENKNLSHDELELKETIINMVEEQLNKDEIYNDKEVARKIVKKLSDKYDL